jgi:2-amino-4-hydroxy-6-hydroxymethyldihydropteridine diphosphokinase
MSERVTVSLGSNIDAENNIRRAVQALHRHYGELRISPVYQTEAVGFEGDDFLNLVVSFRSDEPVETLAAELKAIEDALGRDRSLPKFSSRSIDLDLLTYGDRVQDEGGVQIPRDEILKNAFVLKPLADIHGDMKHPVTGKTLAEHWRRMAPEAARIEPYEMLLEY